MAENSKNDGNLRDKALFFIEKLSCTYSNNSRPVLVAKDVVIPREKITVLLGPSGAGKSTLLETLGLMTKTVGPEDSKIMFYPRTGVEIDLAEMWGAEKEKESYDIRQKYYSFIFQSTNLMPNFTALENVGLTELIQNKSESEAYFHAIETLVKDLSVTSLSYEKKPFAFSGGERQRLAFARAINPDFTVLFGDEPTGNLDHFNSQKLMQFIRDFITSRGSDDHNSAIIVSHNIPLSLDFADRIIVLAKRPDGISTIYPRFVYDRDTLKWYESPERQARLQKEIELLLNSDTESYAKILTHLSENNIDDKSFMEVKDMISTWSILIENYNEKKSGEDKFKWLSNLLAHEEWLKTFIDSKEVDNQLELIKDRIDLYEKNVEEIEVLTKKLNFEKDEVQIDKIKAEISEKDSEILKRSHERKWWIAEKVDVWLRAKLEELELLDEYIEEYVTQFSTGKVKEADNKIDNVVKTIQDLKVKKGVEGQRDNVLGDVVGEGSGKINLASALMLVLSFIPWVILSIPAYISNIFNYLTNIVTNWIKSSKSEEKKPKKVEPENGKSKRKMFYDELVQKMFYKACVGWDYLDIKIKGRVNKVLNIKSNITFIPHDFKHLFFRNETRELLGKGNRNFWLVTVILFFTYLAIGFSNGSLKYLKVKMDDPFVRSVDAAIPSGRQAITARKAIEEFNVDSLQELYNYDSIVTYNKSMIYLKGDQEESAFKGIDGRSIPYNDPLVATIVDPEVNRTIGNAFVGEQDYSMIITRSMAEKIQCGKNPKFVYIKNRSGRGGERYVPIPIRAIVDKLPGDRVEFVVTQFFMDNFSSLGVSRFLYKDVKKLYSYIPIDSSKVNLLEVAIDQFFEDYHAKGGELKPSFIDLYPFEYSYSNMYRIQMSFEDENRLSQTDIDAVFDSLKSSPIIKKYLKDNKISENDLVRAYFPNLNNNARNRGFDYLAVNFNDLNMVDEFAESFTERSGVKIEMSKIEQMKNYNFVTKLTRIISIILIAFSVLMINIFLSNILSTHLNNIKMNIGTFKAFGIDIKRIYQSMMYMFVLLPLVLAIIFAGICGYLGVIYFMMDLMSPFRIERNLYFDLFNGYTLGSVLIMTIVSYYAFSVIINGIFKKTPGDLIYDRSNKA